MRQAGILLPISALPSEYGIGDFGKHARSFIDDLAQANVHIWQILPLHPLGFGASPYQPYSSYAMDELYLDLEALQAMGWIEKLTPFRDTERVEYEAVRAYKLPYVKEAFAHFEPTDKYRSFIKKPWVKPFAMFEALREANKKKCWTLWPKAHQDWIHSDQTDCLGYDKEVDYYMFVQYVLYEQWDQLHTYAKEHHITIMGDMPFYVGLDSLDVWMNQEDFLLDDQYNPTFIAGVPPDYFSKTGQRWGNPIYNWDHIVANKFSFWLDRLHGASELYDLIRIDHFRAFDTYWKIPASCPTAMEGEWVEAPGYAFFDTLFETYPDIQIIAEDLGELRPEVLVLRDHYKLKGMNVLEFTLNPTRYKPSVVNSIVYTGTHDNQTIKGFFEQLDTPTKTKMKTFFKRKGYDVNNISECFVKLAMSEKAEYAIVPLQDVLGLGDEARMNTPGIIQPENWSWRFKEVDLWKKKIGLLRAWINVYQRNNF